MPAKNLTAALLALALVGIPAASMLTAHSAKAQAQDGATPSAQDNSSPSTQGSQPTQEPHQEEQTLSVQSQMIQVYATVRDKHNDVMSNLTKDNFKVYEDGVQQQIIYFGHETDLPITLALLMDTSGSMYNIMNAEKDAASEFVRQVMHKKDEAIVISFDTDADLLADFTEDTNVLTKAIHRAEVRVNSMGIGGTPGTVSSDSGGTNLFDAIYLACHDELATEAGRKTIIVLSDAEDNGSKMSIEEAAEAAQRANAAIHVLLISDPTATEGYGTGIALQLARDTGGRVIGVHNDKTLQKAFDQIAEELRSQYIIGYAPSNAARDGTYRKIKIEVNQADSKVLSRKGYYAPNG